MSLQSYTCFQQVEHAADLAADRCHPRVLLLRLRARRLVGVVTGVVIIRLVIGRGLVFALGFPVLALGLLGTVLAVLPDSIGTANSSKLEMLTETKDTNE